MVKLTGEIVDVYHETQHGQISCIYKESVFANGRVWNEDELELMDEATSTSPASALNMFTSSSTPKGCVELKKKSYYNMAKIDLERFMTSLMNIAPMEWAVVLNKALKDQGLKYDGSEIVPVISEGVVMTEPESIALPKSMVPTISASGSETIGNDILIPEGFTAEIVGNVIKIRKKIPEPECKLKEGEVYKCIAKPPYKRFTVGNLYKSDCDGSIIDDREASVIIASPKKYFVKMPEDTSYLPEDKTGEVEYTHGQGIFKPNI